MLNKKFRICSLIFGLISLAAMVTLLCFAITLPRAYTLYGRWSNEIYYTSLEFNLKFITPVILTFFASFWGIATFFITMEKKEKKVEEPKTEPNVNDAQIGE